MIPEDCDTTDERINLVSYINIRLIERCMLDVKDERNQIISDRMGEIIC